MKIRILAADIHLVDLKTRMPFKYGIATMTHMPQAFVRLQAEVDGQLASGIASDLLPPKWFTKDPEKPASEEVMEMLRVIRHAVTAAIGLQGASAFDVWRQLYQHQQSWGKSECLAPLLTHFGTSFVERALIESVCQAAHQPFFQLLQTNRLGMDLVAIHAELKGKRPSDYLPAVPLGQIVIRHTVGLADPLTEDEISPLERLNDGLPQSLVECIQAYGLRHFKIKVTGERRRDQERLRRLARIIPQYAASDYAFSLDGNEQFHSIEGFREFWEEVERDDSLREFLRHLLFVEQPLHRQAALHPAVGEALKRWPARPPMIIDESDAELESLPEALRLGYSGTSHKNCKGVFKSVANRCLLSQRQQEHPGAALLMSGEDLCNQGPIALLQDLAVMAALGISSVERNGHHYCAGLSLFSPRIQQQVRNAHSDLYRLSPARWPTLSIQNGTITVTSLNQSPFGVGFHLDVAEFSTAEEWQSRAR